MAGRGVNTDIEATIQLDPSEQIQHALGANHDIRTGLDELVDNSIDAEAKNIRIVFHVDGFRLVQIAVHDDGVGMDFAKMKRVLRLGGHETKAQKNIGIYGLGLKEGSYANADLVTVASRVKGQFASGIQLKKQTFAAGVLRQQSLTKIWNLRDRLVGLKHGTTIVWNDLSTVYQGPDEAEGLAFLSSTIEKIRQHLGIRYHRYLKSNRVTIKMFTIYDGDEPVPNPEIKAVDPCGYRKSGNQAYPRTLTVGGQKGAPGVTAHIWTNKSKTDQFLLEGRDELGHQGFYVYMANRLITQGGWSGFREARKELKLLRLVIDDPRVVERYIVVSPQKGAVRLEEGFHRFVESLRADDGSGDTFEDVCTDAAEVLRLSNRHSGKATPIAEGGRGLAPAVKAAIEDYAPLKSGAPVNVQWADLEVGEFVSVDSTESTVYLNSFYREMLNAGNSTFTDAPLVKTLVYLLFNEAASSKRTAKSRANIELWSKILATAAEEQLEQNNPL